MCVCVLPADVKRLAEKEDWVVDSDGLTSLVSSERSLLVCVPLTVHGYLLQRSVLCAAALTVSRQKSKLLKLFSHL